MPQNMMADAQNRLQKLIARSKAEKARFEQVTDSEYWVAFCFETREQKQEFLEKAGLIDEGDKHVDGLAFAKAIGIDIESPRVQWQAKTR